MENKTNYNKSNLKDSFATKKDLAKLMERLTNFYIIIIAVTLICTGLLFVQGSRFGNELSRQSSRNGDKFNNLRADLAEIKALLNQRKK